MKKRFFAVALTLLMLLATQAACGGGGGMAAANADEAVASTDMQDGWSEPAESTAVIADGAAETPTLTDALKNSKIILSGRMELQSQQFAQTDEFLRNLTAELGGYMESMTVMGEEGYHIAYYTARIPGDKFDSFTYQIGQSCHVLEESQNVENITEQYVDIEARLASLNTKHDRLLALLAKAENMETIIALETALAETEYEIERHTGSLRKYDNLVSFSTMELTLREVNALQPVSTGSFLSELRSAAIAGGQGLISFARAFCLGLAAAWPLLLVLLIFIGAIVTLRKRKRAAAQNRREENDENTPHVP